MDFQSGDFYENGLLIKIFEFYFFANITFFFSRCYVLWHEFMFMNVDYFTISPDLIKDKLFFFHLLELRK